MDSKDVKEGIINFLQKNGPSLPVNIAKAVYTNSLFTGAYLSELFGEKSIKMSNMKLGNSSLYYLAGQENQLEKFIDYLKSKEKEACLLLKGKGILRDSEQEPAIRIALRTIKDFAFPFRNGEEIIWKYLTFDIKEEDLKKEIKEPVKILETIPLVQKPLQEIKNTEQKIEVSVEQLKQMIEEKVREIKEEPKKISESVTLTAEQLKELAEKEIEKEIKEEQKDNLEELERALNEIKKKKNKINKPKKETPKDKFIKEVQRILQNRGLTLMNIDKADKNQLIGRTISQDKENLVIAINKKNFELSDLLKVNKKYLGELPLMLISKSGLSKKANEMINASRRVAEAICIEDKEEKINL